MPRIFPSLLAAILVAGTFHGSTDPSTAQQSGVNNEKSPATQPRSRNAQPRREPRKKPVVRRQRNKIQQAAAGQRQARPRNNAVLKGQKLPPGFNKFLADWERQTSADKRKRLTADIEEFEYNSVFFTEKRGTAKIKFEAPDKASLKMTPKKIKPGDISTRVDPEGKPYDLSGLDPQRWVCTGKEIYQIDDKGKEFNVVQIPPKMQGARINEGPIPFLFGLKAAEAKKRFRFFKLKPPKPNPYPNSFWFKAVPRRKIDRQEYREAYVILDTKNFVPIAIKLVDPTGNTERSYTFKNVKINPRRFWERGPFIKPNLKGYKWVGNANGAAPPPKGQLQPKPARPKQAQPGRVRIGGGNRPPARKPLRK